MFKIVTIWADVEKEPTITLVQELKYRFSTDTMTTQKWAWRYTTNLEPRQTRRWRPNGDGSDEKWSEKRESIVRYTSGFIPRRHSRPSQWLAMAWARSIWPERIMQPHPQSVLQINTNVASTSRISAKKDNVVPLDHLLRCP